MIRNKNKLIIYSIYSEFAQWLAKKQKETDDKVPCIYSIYSRLKPLIFCIIDDKLVINY